MKNIFADACNKALDSTLCNEHEGKLYCKNCYAGKFGPNRTGLFNSKVEEPAA